MSIIIKKNDPNTDVSHQRFEMKFQDVIAPDNDAFFI
jgi:hypothetical protein